MVESALQHGAQPLRDRLIQHVVIELVQDILAVGVAGQKGADAAVDGRHLDLDLLYWDASEGEVHRELSFAGLLCHNRSRYLCFGHARYLSNDTTLTNCNSRLSHAVMHLAHAKMHGTGQHRAVAVVVNDAKSLDGTLAAGAVWVSGPGTPQSVVEPVTLRHIRGC